MDMTYTEMPHIQQFICTFFHFVGLPNLNFLSWHLPELHIIGLLSLFH